MILHGISSERDHVNVRGCPVVSEVDSTITSLTTGQPRPINSPLPFNGTLE